MRRIFIVSGKIIGLLQIFWGLTYLSSISLFMSQMGRTEPSMARAMAIQIGGVAGYAVLAFGMAWLLLARTEWLADKLKIPTDDHLPSLSDDVLLRAGIKLIGVYVLATAVPALARAVAEVATFSAWQSYLGILMTRLVPAVFRVAIAILLAIRTDFVLRVISRGENTHGKKILIGGFVLLLLYALLARGLDMHPWLRQRGMTSPGSVGRSLTEEHTVIREPATNAPARDEWFGTPDWDDGHAVATNVVTVEISEF
ncbi:MAG: hypothetical protein HQ559_02350 [Lentisphaerae bacterium]|nr:hypothetical protein [Lentisphaerota bacterium]